MSVKGNLAADVTLSGVGIDPLKPTLNVLNVSGNIVGSDIHVAGNINSISATKISGSQIFAGFSGTADGVGTFSPSATINVLRATGVADAFEDSHVIASTINAATIKSVKSSNSGTKFGLIADIKIGSVVVTLPQAFKYDPKNSSAQGFGDFEVKIV
jgi:hypothetical protein